MMFSVTQQIGLSVSIEEAISLSMISPLRFELEIRNHLQACQPVNMLKVVTLAMKSNNDVLFYWSMISAGWNESSGSTLQDMVINMWVCIRGFSYFSAWIEKYNEVQKKKKKKTTQKS